MNPDAFFPRAFALGGFLAVLLGAVGAHVLRGALDERGQMLWQTAVQYHFWHILALGWIVQRLERRPACRWLKWSGAFFVGGITLFSGGLYLVAATGVAAFARIAPFGGVALMLGWLALLVHSFRPNSP
ncbi:MAG TPA: DUF423 domain-containing protein [Methylococcaceae bacterium]|nr:DUF423 domain-containing protein [Methylococcaceae bacterium]